MKSSTEQSPNLPVGWLVSALGDIATFEMGQAPAGAASNFTGVGTVFVKAGEFGLAQPIVREWTTEPKKYAKKGDVLICVVGATAGKLNLGIDCAIGRSVAAIRPEIGVKQKTIYFQLLPNVERMRANVSGSAQGVISQADLSRLALRVPPAAEQTRIVEKLEELLSDLDAGVAELKAAQKKLAQYRQSLLKAAVEGALTADWRAARRANAGPVDPSSPPSFPRRRESSSGGATEALDPRLRGDDEAETGAQLLARILTERRNRWQARRLAKFQAQGKTPPKDWQAKYLEPVAPDAVGLPDLPQGWVWATVDQLAVEQKYGTSAKTNSDSVGVPVIRMGNIQDGELDLDVLKYLPADHDEFPALHLQHGDMLFNRTNSPELVGKTAVYRSELLPCSYASYLIGVRFADLYVPELASAVINSSHGRKWVKSVVTQQVGQANVNGTKLAALAIPLPPFEEQQEIIRVLAEQRAGAFVQSKNVEKSLKQSAAQRKNILQAAFSGQLVPQDPADEPASVLLARIRAERAAREAGSARGRGKKKVST